MFLRVSGYLLAHLGQQIGIPAIVGFVDNYLFSRYISLDTKPQELSEEMPIGIKIKHYRIFISLIGYKNSHRNKHAGRQTSAEPHRPDASSRHLVTRVVEDIIHDKHQHRYDNGYSQTAFTDDRTQRSTDEKEDKTQQR